MNQDLSKNLAKSLTDNRHAELNIMKQHRQEVTELLISKQGLDLACLER